MLNVVAYLRVSTREQGKSGLGIDAQLADIKRAAAANDWHIVNVYKEIGVSGAIKPLDRPVCARAFTSGYTVVVSKLDRLSRNVAAIATLMESKVPFRVAATPLAQPFELHIHASLAQQERTMISQRTKDALVSLKTRADAGDMDAIEKIARRTAALAKGRGKENGAKGAMVNKTRADDQACNLVDIIESCIKKGANTLQSLANCLNNKGITTARGCSWNPTQVSRIMTRAAITF